MLQIRFILIWIRILGSVSWNNGSGSESCSKSDLKSGKYQLLFDFFYYKKYISPKYDLFCYLWGKYLSVNIKIVLKKCMIFLWFRWFSWKFSMIFIEADPDPADQNETDPNWSGSATLLYTLKVESNFKISPKVDNIDASITSILKQNIFKICDIFNLVKIVK